MDSVIFAAQVRRKLAASPSLLKTKRAVWAMGRRSDARIIRSFPIFTPNSSGSLRDRAALTIQSANQTFPLMLELLSRRGGRLESSVQIESFADSVLKKGAAE